MRLPVSTNEGISDYLQLGIIDLETPEQAPPIAVLPIPYPDDTIVSDFSFLGHDLYKQGFGHAPETPLLPGDSLHLTTFWRANTRPDGDYQFELLLDGMPLGRYPLAGTGYPTSRWEPGHPWRGEITTILPAELSSGEKHILAIQLLGPDGEAVGIPIALEPTFNY